MEIDIKRLKEIKKELEDLGKEDVLFVNEDGQAKYALMPIELFDEVEDFLPTYEEDDFGSDATIRVVSPNALELSYDEYEAIKEQILKAFDKTFKPKPEKLN